MNIEKIPITEDCRESLLHVGDAVLRCYVTKDGRRLINSDDLEEFFGGKEAFAELLNHATEA